MRLRGVAVFAACGLAAHAWAASFHGQVTHVTDGDTVWVRPVGGGAARELRLDAIDAPEGCQPHGREARAALSRRVMGQAVRVHWTRRDDYGRLVATVTLDGQDVGRWLVQEGHAWAPRWRRKDGPYATEERMARQARRGLWAGEAPMEPRVFRQFHGSCASAGSELGAWPHAAGRPEREQPTAQAQPEAVGSLAPHGVGARDRGGVAVG